MVLRESILSVNRCIVLICKKIELPKKHLKPNQTKMNLVDEPILAPATWERTEPQKQLYTSNDVIDAYLQGQKEGLKHEKQLVYDRLAENMEKAGNHTYRVLSQMKESGITPEDAFLRIESWNVLTVLILLSENDFLNPKMLSIYQFVSQLEKEVDEEMYRLQISFCDREDAIDMDHIYADGYMYKYKVGH